MASVLIVSRVVSVSSGNFKKLLEVVPLIVSEVDVAAPVLRVDVPLSMLPKLLEIEPESRTDTVVKLDKVVIVST